MKLSLDLSSKLVSSSMLVLCLAISGGCIDAEDPDDAVGDGDGDGDGDGEDPANATCKDYCELFSELGCPGAGQCNAACPYYSDERFQCVYAELLTGDCEDGGFYSTKC